MLGLVLFAVGAYLGWLTSPHIQERVAYWIHALEPARVQAIGYGQLAQGWFAFASGGMVGTGLGLGSPTLIPYVGSDFILAAFGEELGMLGVAAVLLLYLVVIGRGLRIGIDRPDAFGKLLAVGLTTVVGLQVFVIAAGVLRLIPLDRRAAAARVVRRNEPRRHLHHPRAADPRLRGPVATARGGAAMDKQIRRLGIAFVALFAVLFAQVAYVQVFAADRIANNDANAARKIRAQYSVQRGEILASDNLTVLAAASRTPTRPRRSATSASIPRASSTGSSPATTRGCTASAGSRTRWIPTWPAPRRSSRRRTSPT